MKPQFDCVVIGAGCAGLACARQLADRGLKVQIIESRGRIGGRVHTVRSPLLKLPLELGAEFIHGAPEPVFKRLEALGTGFYDVLDDHHFLKNGKLRPTGDFWDKMEEAMKKLDPKRKKDRSVAEFLKEQNLSKEDEALFASFVEGFHAADLNLISERGLASSEQVSSDLNGSMTFRPTRGYKALLESYLASASFELKLATTVRKIDWKKGWVNVHTETRLGEKPECITARTCVITVPLGVLKSGAIEFDPVPKGFVDGIQSMHMGHASRIAFVFSSRFWEDGFDQRIGFLHAGPEFDFPTWWTMMPMRAPVLVAWQGGPKAEALGKLTSDERAKRALATLSKLFSIDRARLDKLLIGYHTHNWSKDPFSLGAYSYLGIEGDRRAEILANPFEDTLLFAGEATHHGSSHGTVDGALDTGERAARQVLELV